MPIPRAEARRPAEPGPASGGALKRRLCFAGTVLVLAAAACERKAPGPVECQKFALRVVGVGDAAALSHPLVKAQVDSWTTRCLTTPYDRELLACVEQGERNCYQSFAARHPDRARRDARRSAE